MKPTRKPHNKPKKPGRKGGKVRSHVTLGENLDTAAEFLGAKSFGNKSAYLEHLVANDLERQGLTVLEIAKLAEEWRKEQAGK